MVGESQNQVLIPPFFLNFFVKKNEDLLRDQMIRDQNNMLFIVYKKFRFKKIFPVTRQNTLALIIGMKLSSSDSKNCQIWNEFVKI
jgi:hypothetical protein